jgi:hypothetical protein
MCSIFLVVTARGCMASKRCSRAPRGLVHPERRVHAAVFAVLPVVRIRNEPKETAIA